MPTFTLRRVLLLAFIIRLILIPFFSDDFNYWANMTFTSFLINGRNPWTIVYNDPTLHWINPWRSPPLQLFLIIPGTIINGFTGNYTLMLYAIKLPLILIDLLSIFFVYKILRMWSDNESKNIRYLSLFAFNPISLIASPMVGSTDPLPTLLLVLSVYYFIKPNENSTIRKNLSALFLGLAIAAKLFPIVFVPIFLLKLSDNRRRIVFVILSLLPLALVSLPFLIWDYGSYLNMLLLLNVGGIYPFVAFLSPGLNDVFRILAAASSLLMFAIAYIRKTNIMVNMVLAFLALYGLMGFGYFDSKYFLWFIPFAVLLASRKETLRISGLDFLPFIYVPSLIEFLIYNGPRNSVEGMTGFFYFAYQWLRLKVITSQVLPFSDLIYIASGIATILLFAYFFGAIMIRAPSSNFPSIELERLNLTRGIKKNGKLILSLALITLILTLGFARVLPFETLVSGVQIDDSTLHFNDGFSRSILNPQWSVAGNGSYTIEYREKPSSIRLDGNITVYRGWGPIWQGFKESNEAEVSLIYRLDYIPKNVNKSSILVTNGGWLGIMEQNQTYYFVYFDQMTNSTVLKAQADYQWHEFQLDYQKNARVIIFDTELSATLPQEGFSYLCLGLPINSTLESRGISFSVDQIDVNIKNFYPSLPWDALYAFLALFVPYAILLCVLVFASRGKQNMKRFLTLFRKSQRLLPLEAGRAFKHGPKQVCLLGF